MTDKQTIAKLVKTVSDQTIVFSQLEGDLRRLKADLQHLIDRWDEYSDTRKRSWLKEIIDVL